MDKRYLNWNDVDRAINRLVASIHTSGIKFEAVGGLPRGGLIAAVMLSHRLSIPFVAQANIASVAGDILVVDDICDTGETLKNKVAGFTATLHYKPTASFTPDFYAKEVGTEWIVYPWERKDSEPIPDYLKK